MAEENYVQRDTKQGTLKGIIKTARNGDEYHAFLAVPYAKPPVDELRWEKPIPASSWEGVRDATENPNMCMQEHVLNPEMVEGRANCRGKIVYLIMFIKKDKDNLILQ